MKITSDGLSFLK